MTCLSLNLQTIILIFELQVFLLRLLCLCFQCCCLIFVWLLFGVAQCAPLSAELARHVANRRAVRQRRSHRRAPLIGEEQEGREWALGPRRLVNLALALRAHLVFGGELLKRRALVVCQVLPLAPQRAQYRRLRQSYKQRKRKMKKF